MVFVDYSAPDAVAFAEGADEVGAQPHEDALLVTVVCTGPLCSVMHDASQT